MATKKKIEVFSAGCSTNREPIGTANLHSKELFSGHSRKWLVFGAWFAVFARSRIKVIVEEL